MTFIQKIPIHSINTPNIVFRNTQTAGIPRYSSSDIFTTNPLEERYRNAQQVESIAKSNPRILQILKECNIPLRVNVKELDKLQKGHLRNARVTAAKIYSALPDNMKKEVNMQNLQQAAMFHDYGKILIPEEILNKKGKLTESERAIMEQHAELGYELLKESGLNDETLKLIKYHHQNPTGSGYPKITDNFEYSISSEILRAADEFTALTEERPYKHAMSKEDALSILSDEVTNGMISQPIYNGVKKAV